MTAKRRYMLCVRNEGAEDLELRKVYEVLSDPEAAKHHLLRVIDESGEDYLYPDALFSPVDLPAATKRVLASTSVSRTGARSRNVSGSLHTARKA